MHDLVTQLRGLQVRAARFVDDGELRSLALKEQLTLHGVLWLLDECEKHNAASVTQLSAGLNAIASHPRCRLPRKEISERLTKWQA